MKHHSPKSQTKAPVTRSARVIEQIRQAILDGEYEWGTRLNEITLVSRFRVSRTPIRAAMQMLTGEGLLIYEENKGFTVRHFPLSEIIDAYEIRALAEGLSTRLASERGLNEDARATIEHALATGDMALSGKGDPQNQRATYSEANEAFHAAIHKAASSSLVAHVIRLSQRVPQASARNIIAFDIEDVRQRHRAHHEIYEAMLAREPLRAEMLMREHILAVKLLFARQYSRLEFQTSQAKRDGLVHKSNSIVG
jgi:GntR family transcriptional regulator, vanillate catabolism transcriptional regulator